jgi:peroxiredoxin
MIESGDEAPSFTLPAVREGDIVEFDLDSVLGGEVLILAFYPGDFNPACSGTETGLDELDLFTMQKDVQVLAISGDSVYSHRAFADQYDLHMPLLSDIDGTVAAAYGVTADGDQPGHLTKRAVVVVDHTETVQYTWETDTPEHVPTAEKLRDVVEGIGDDETAESRYRVGYAHYMEGRRAFTSAMNAYENREWMMAQTDFTQAAEEFSEASDEFNTAVRFAEGGESRTYFERGEQKSEALWRAADWLSDSASAFASGEGAKAESLRSDAESPLETARDLHEPPEPDDFPPETDPAERDTDDEPNHPPADDDEPAATLDADIDDEIAAGTDEEPTASQAETTTSTESHADGTAETEPGETQTAEASTEIDDDELEEITAELEEQTEAAELSDPEPEGDTIPEEPGIERGDDHNEGDVELELTDPTDGESEESDEDNSLDDDTGDHGVPDSL